MIEEYVFSFLRQISFFSVIFTRNCSAHITQKNYLKVIVMYFTSDNHLESVSQEENYCSLCIKLQLNCASWVLVKKKQASLHHNLRHQRIDRFSEINSVFRYIIANLKSIELKSFQTNLQEWQTQNLAPSCPFLYSKTTNEVKSV